MGRERGSLDSKAGWVLVHVLRTEKPYSPCREKDMMINEENDLLFLSVLFLHFSLFVVHTRSFRTVLLLTKSLKQSVLLKL